MDALPDAFPLPSLQAAVGGGVVAVLLGQLPRGRPRQAQPVRRT
jgi:hypothetical protein